MRQRFDTTRRPGAGPGQLLLKMHAAALNRGEFIPGGLIKGKLGADLDIPAGADAAKSCAISLLAQLKKACGGDLSRVVRAVKLVGFVNSTVDFVDQPKVINGASDFLVAALGDAGRHARSAVSAASLPLGVAVEIEGIFEIR